MSNYRNPVLLNRTERKLMTVLVSYALIFTGGDKTAVFALEFTRHV